jgi:hypothetical protein
VPVTSRGLLIKTSLALPDVPAQPVEGNPPPPENDEEVSMSEDRQRNERDAPDEENPLSPVSSPFFPPVSFTSRGLLIKTSLALPDVETQTMEEHPPPPENEVEVSKRKGRKRNERLIYRRETRSVSKEEDGKEERDKKGQSTEERLDQCRKKKKQRKKEDM